MSERQDAPEGTVWRNVRMSETLFRELGASRVDWGEPDADGFYTPTLTRYRLPLRTRLLVLWRRLTGRAIPYRDRWT